MRQLRSTPLGIWAVIALVSFACGVAWAQSGGGWQSGGPPEFGKAMSYADEPPALADGPLLSPQPAPEPAASAAQQLAAKVAPTPSAANERIPDAESHIRSMEEIDALLKAVLSESRLRNASDSAAPDEAKPASEAKPAPAETPEAPASVAQPATAEKPAAPADALDAPAQAAQIPPQAESPPPPPAEPSVVPPAPQPVAEVASDIQALTLDAAVTSKLLETKPRQVRIRARILEWRHDKTIDWGFGLRRAPVLDEEGNPVNPDLADVVRMADLFLPSQAQQLNQGLALFFKGLNDKGDSGVEAFVQALDQLGDVTVLCSPEIVLICPEAQEIARVAALPVEQRDAATQKGIVSTKSRIPYESVQPAGNVLVEVTAYKDAATQMTVTNPEIVREKFVKMTVNASVTDLSGYIAVGTNSRGEIMMVPQTDSRSITNTVLVGDRQLFIMGVLKTTNEHSNTQGVPWISRIPGLGFLFKNYQNRMKDQELLFVVQPEIVRS